MLVGEGAEEAPLLVVTTGEEEVVEEVAESMKEAQVLVALVARELLSFAILELQKVLGEPLLNLEDTQHIPLLVGEHLLRKILFGIQALLCYNT